jgi:TRAP-type uncharacterized transport system substrate-binding protein
MIKANGRGKKCIFRKLLEAWWIDASIKGNSSSQLHTKNSAMDIADHSHENRRTRLIALIGIIAIVAIATWLLFTVLRSMRIQTVVMAVCPEGSLNAELVKRYRQVLARNGIDVKLAPSAGGVESLAQVRDPKSGVSVALIPDGITTKQESPELVSLGTVFYQPLWIFSHGPLPHGHVPFRGRRVSIGTEGSASRALSLELLGRAGWIDSKSTMLWGLAPAESAEALIRGEIDAATFVDGWDSPLVQRLLRINGIDLESLPGANAFVRIYPYLSKLVLPAGAVDLVEPRPATDMILIGPKCSLVARNDLHAAIQYRLLEAAVEIHSTPSMFRNSGEFPEAESVNLPLSPYARDFYKAGSPFLLRHLPLWLAVLLEQPAVLLIPLVVLLVPLFRIAPPIYNWVERRRVYRLYSELKRLEDEMSYSAHGGDDKDILERLDQLEYRASHLSVPSAFKPLAYGLRLHIDMIRHEVEKSPSKLAKIATGMLRWTFGGTETFPGPSLTTRQGDYNFTIE